jgi:uncharacterized membrane protein YjjB (DUF3815 family)
MTFLIQGVYSFICVLGFSIILNLPRRLLFIASISGMVGWLMYIFVQNFTSNFILPAFIGSIFVGLLGELFAILLKHPATLFTIPGIIPFVPGYGIYYTMYHIVNQDFDAAMTQGATALFIAISIACGIVLATSVMRLLRPFIRQYVYKKM